MFFLFFYFVKNYTMKKIYFFVITSLALFTLFSCDKNNSGSTENNSYVNQWIFDEMSTYYLWNENIPARSKLNFDADPSDFFYSLLYKYKQLDGDRFSWIRENYIDLLNSLSGISNYDVGFEYVGYLETEGSSNVIAQVAYIKPGTPAEQLGIKRGDFFNRVNGTRLNTSNWRSLFNSATATVTFIKSGGATEEKNITLTKDYAENPVYLDSIYTEGANKIGYLVYNFFAPDGGNDSHAYDIKLNNVFGKFKAASITHLVLDLRYNSGGSMNSATLLGSMIVPNLNTNEVFTKLQYNTLLSNAFGSSALIDKFRDNVETSKTSSVPLNNVGNNLQKVYILTSGWTASASELIINNLEPYCPNINIVGDTTVGKNVGSVSRYEKNNPNNKWGIQPIILRYTNKNGVADFLEGFIPDIAYEDNALTKLELGNKNEAMLNIALSMINGTYSPSSRQATDIELQPVGASVENKAWANQVIVDFKQLKE